MKDAMAGQKKKVLVVDVDGGVCFVPVPVGMGRLLYRSLMSIPLVRWLYDSRFRRPNPAIVQLMRDLRNNGWHIVAISGARENYRPALEMWFRTRGVVLDELCLHRAGTDVPHWKTGVVNELAERAKYLLYIDDLPENLRGPFAKNVTAIRIYR